MSNDLGELLTKESAVLTKLAEATVDRNQHNVTAGLANLLTALLTDVPVLGTLLEKTVLRAFANSVNAQLDAELAALAADADRRAFAAQIAEVLEPLIGQALIQIVRSQNNLASEQKQAIVAELGGLRDDLADFRADFARELTAGSLEPDTVRLDLINIRDQHSIGIRVGAGTTKRVFVKRMEVSNGGVGIDLT